jgi:hypothetical protein
METLKQQIIEKLEASGFQVDMENVSWKKQETNTTGGATISINGQTFQQPGQQITVTKYFTILYECRISDVGEQNPHDSLMCTFEVYEDDNKVQDLEINIYPDEIDFFNNLSRKIFDI